MNLGSNIQKYRKAAGLTQKKLAEILNVAVGTIQQYETNKREPKIETIKKIATALDVDPFSLYSFDMATEALENEINQKESKLLDNYRSLNTTGKEEAEKRVEELTEIPRYTKPDEPQEQ